MKKSINTANRLSPWITFLILLAVWELIVRIKNIPRYILPGPADIFDSLLASYKLIAFHTATTLMEALLGFVFAVITAFLIAFLLNNVKWLNQAIYPIIIVTQTIPVITLAPLFLIWFGWGLLPKIIVVILVCFFPVVINLLKGLNSVDPDLINLFRSMGAGRLATFKMVKLPAALPGFFSGLKISASYSIMAAIIGEWLGAKQGLGYFMTLSQKSFRVDKVLAAVVVISVLSLLIVKLIDLVEWITVPWNRPSHDIEKE